MTRTLGVLTGARYRGLPLTVLGSAVDPDDGSHRLRAVRRLQRAARLGGDVTQLQLGTG